MNEEIIKDLQDQIARLQNQVDALQDCAFKHFDEFTNQICEHSRDIGQLYHIAMPAFKKLRPGYDATTEQIDLLLNRDSARKKDNSGENGA